MLTSPDKEYFLFLLLAWQTCFAVCCNHKEMTTYDHDIIIVTREEWGAREPREPLANISVPVNMTFIHHSAGSWHGTTPSECIRQVRSIQDFHMDERGWSDIAYSFLICEDGRVYEGRGWTAEGAHTLGYNKVSLGICIIGDYTSRLPAPGAIAAAKHLLQSGIHKGYLTHHYELFGHRDGRVGTDCPGDALYADIHNWRHFSTRPIHKYGKQ
jgi:N-acetylmuramoyl-L-alanine amidase